MINTTIKNIKHIIINIKFMLLYSWKMAKNRYFFAIFIIILDSFQPVFSLIMPKYIIDELTTGKQWIKICIYIFLFVFINLFFNLIRIFLNYKSAFSLYKSNVNFSVSFANLWAKMDYRLVESSDLRDKLGQIAEYTHPIKFIDSTFTALLVNFIQFMSYGYIVFTLNPFLIIVILFCTFLSIIISKEREQIGYNDQPIFIKFNRKFAYIFQAMTKFDFAKEVRINGADAWLAEKYKNQTREYLSFFKKNQNKNFILRIYELLLSFVQTIFLYGYGSFRVINQKITIGTFSVYLETVSLFITSFMDMITRITSLKYLSQYVDDYRKYIDPILNSSKANDQILVKEKNKHIIEFVDVSFKYPNTDRYVLKNISIKIESGKKLAIVGYNGSGKTTLSKMLLGLISVTEGEVFFQGKPRDIKTRSKKKEYWKGIQAIFQDPFSSFNVFNKIDSVLLDCINMRGGKKLPYEKKVEMMTEACSFVNLKFDELTNKYPFELSGGQMQRLMIARIFLLKPKILLADEQPQ